MKRYIKTKKFYTTLPHKLDAAEVEWLKAQPDEPELDWEWEETSEFGNEGWTISFTHKSVKKDQ